MAHGSIDFNNTDLGPNSLNSKFNNLQVCSRCIYDENISGITFDEDGVCNYCHQVDAMADRYGTGMDKGKKTLERYIAKMKRDGKRKKYDCIIGVSGGTDSSYLMLKAVDWGLRPLAVHYDNTWNNACATQNIHRVTKALGIDLFTYVVNNKEADDIYRATFYAGIPEWDSSSDIAFVQVLRSAAAKYGIKYILEGHSFQAEGISPVHDNYFDGKYVSSIHKLYGSIPMRTFPNLTFARFLKWLIIYRQQFIRPLWYINYSKKAARYELQRRTGWQYYGGHHLENRAAVFGHTVYAPQKFKLDYRFLALAASARSGELSREDALSTYRNPLQVDPDIVEYVKKRLELTDEQYSQVMQSTPKTWRDYPTYKSRFELLRPLFHVLARVNIVPMSFYLKYCFPVNVKP